MVQSRAVAAVLAAAVVALAAPAAAGAGGQPAGPTPAGVQPASTNLPYADVCDDAGGDALDLRAAEIQPRSGALALTVYTCAAWPDSALDARTVRWDLRDAGALAASVLVTRTDGALLWTATGADGDPSGEGGAERISFAGERRGLRATVPLDALGLPDSFTLTVRVEDDGVAADHLPDTGEPPVSYPDPCPERVTGAVVRTERSGYADAVAAARAAGLEVSAQAPGVASFAVDGPPEALAGLPGVTAVDRRVGVQRLGVVPDDPSYPEQWALEDIDAPRAWRLRSGSASRVAVVDDGVDAERADLAGRVAAGHDTRFDKELPAGQSSDRGGHGTAVASVLTAQGDNGVDIAGVDWAATIVPYRIFDAAGCGDDVHVAAAITRAADEGVDVVNLSLGTPHDTPVLRDAVRYAHDRGTVLVAAVGNVQQVGNAPLYPAAYPEVIGVGATLRGGTVAAYSASGPHVHVVAPGGQGSSGPAGDLLALGERGAIRTVAGTSFATPIVAAAAALYRAVDPVADPGTVADALATTARRAGDGRDDAEGHGRVDLFRLLLQAGINRACPPGDVPPAGFDDVVAAGVHAPAIDCAVWRGIARGVRAGEYAPARPVTRGQMASFVVRLVEEAAGPLPSTGDHFPDDDGNHHEDSINKLAEAGVVEGLRGRYGPDRAVTRDQMATFLARASALVTGEALAGGRSPFTDVAGNVHEDAIHRTYEAGFVRGRSEASFDPRGAVRRDQMASFLRNLLAAFVRDGHM